MVLTYDFFELIRRSLPPIKIFATETRQVLNYEIQQSISVLTIYVDKLYIVRISEA